MTTTTDQAILQRACDIANRKSIEHAERFLTRVPSALILTYGVESIESVSGDTLEYLNTGDTYDTTLCRENNGEWFIGSWSDWLEESENQYDAENNTVKCGYCSHHTPIEFGDVSLTVCENCGRNASTGAQADSERSRLLKAISRNPFIRAFVDTLLWSETIYLTESDFETCSNSEPADANHTVDDIDTDGLREIVNDCVDFWNAQRELIETDGAVINPNRSEAAYAAGHDFCLTRNGHGAGFWDGDWDDDIGRKLTDASKPYGTLGLMYCESDEFCLYVHN